MILNEFFDDIYCVNLSERVDKWEDTYRLFADIDCDLNKFDAVNGFTAGIPPQMPDPNFEIAGLRGFTPMRPGQVGCLLSHLGIIRKAQANGYKNVMIVEDDIQFDSDLFPDQCKFLEEVPDDWDMIYFGGNHQTKPEPIKFEGVFHFVPNHPKPQQLFSDVVSKTSCTFTTHCLAINLHSPMIDQLVFMIQQVALPVDVCYAHFHAAHNVFTSSKKITWQREAFSDIEQRVVNYDSVLKENE